MPDIECTWTPSFALVRPVTPAGADWLAENVGNEETMFFAGAIVVEFGYLESIVLSARDEGLVVESAN